MESLELKRLEKVVEAREDAAVAKYEVVKAKQEVVDTQWGSFIRGMVTFAGGLGLYGASKNPEQITQNVTTLISLVGVVVGGLLEIFKTVKVLTDKKNENKNR